MKDPRALVGVLVSLVAVILLLYVVDVREVLAVADRAPVLLVGGVARTPLLAEPSFIATVALAVVIVVPSSRYSTTSCDRSSC